MGKIYFKYGVMSSSKSAQALMQKFSLEERNRSVWLIKPTCDTRDGKGIIKSRIGISMPCDTICKDENIFLSFLDRTREKTKENGFGFDAIIVDEVQFLSPMQIDQLRSIADNYSVSIYCYGLRTDFCCRFFEGSRRLMEVADTFDEIKVSCNCGNKATVSARIDSDGKILREGEQFQLGDAYVPMCHSCWSNKTYIEEELN